MTLNVDVNGGAVTGSNLWKVVESPYPWAGKTAKEFLSGTYDSKTRVLEVAGTSKDDEENIIALDAYRLTLSEDGTSLSGNTKCNSDSWRVSGPASMRRSPRVSLSRKLYRTMRLITITTTTTTTTTTPTTIINPCDSFSSAQAYFWAILLSSQIHLTNIWPCRAMRCIIIDSNNNE